VWDLIKYRINEKYGFLADKKKLREAWLEEWDLLDIENDINPLIRK